MRGLLWMCLLLLAAWPARTQSSVPKGCAGVTCDLGQECRLRHICDDATTLPSSYLSPCRDRPECVPTVTCAGHRCQSGHHCRLEADPAPAAGQYRPPLQRAGCQKTRSCDELRCQAGEGCVERQVCEYSLNGYLPPCETLYECRSEAESGVDKTKSGAEVARSDADAAKSGKEADKSGGEVAGGADPSLTLKTAAEKDQLVETLQPVSLSSPIPAIGTDAQTAQSDEDGSSLTALGELEKVLLDDAEVGSVLSVSSNSVASADQPVDEESPAVPTGDYQAPQSVKTTESNSATGSVPDNPDPESVPAALDIFTALTSDIPLSNEPTLIPDIVPSFETASPESALTSQADPIPESVKSSEPVSAPESKLSSKTFSDIIVITPESLRTPESAPALESPPARRSVGARTCAGTRCTAGRRCVLQRSRPTCQRLTCKDTTCSSGTRCLIMGGVPVCRPPPSPRPPAQARPGTATSCDAIQCPDNKKCVLAGGRAWCARRRTCARLRCRYDQECQLRGGRPRCAIRRSCDGVSCAAGKVCQLIGRLPRCVIAPQCADLNCGPNERCISVGGTPTCLTAPACYDRRCPPRQECRVVGDEHVCVDTPTCEELRCGQGRVCREYFGAAKCITATTCANTRCRHDQKCAVRDNLARCVSLKGAPCGDDGGCAEGLECRPVDGKPTCVKPATCDGFSCLSGQRCAVLSGTPTCVASCAAADCAPDLFCRVKVDRAVCAECELDCPTGQVCKLRDPRDITSEYVASRKKIPQCVTEEA